MAARKLRVCGFSSHFYYFQQFWTCFNTIKMDLLPDFLKGRGVSEEIILRLGEQKIDVQTLPLLSHEKLKDYLPCEGDQLAAVDFCKKCMPHACMPQNEGLTKRIDLVSKLKSKFKLGKIGESEEKVCRKPSIVGNKNASKMTRIVDIGWMNFDEKCLCFKQVRERRGGGTRPITVSKTATKADLLSAATNLFFPGGKNRFGSIDEFDCQVMDYQEMELDDNITVSSIYEKTRLRKLRFYLYTRNKALRCISPAEGENDTSNLHEKSSVHVPGGEEQSVIPSSTKKTASSIFKGVLGRPWELPKLLHGQNVDQDVGSTSNNEDDPMELIWQQDSPLTSLVSPASSREMSSQSGDDMHVYEPGGNFNIEDLVSNHDMSFQAQEGNEPVTEVIELLVSNEEITLQTPQSNCDNQLDTDVQNESAVSMHARNTQVIKINRGNCLSDMISAFTDSNILNDNIVVKRVLPNGNCEEGSGSGVVLDCLTEFWEEFCEKCTLGKNAKVPFIRHDFQESQWRAVARIYLLGWQRFSYLPIALALPFIEEVLYGCIYTDLIHVYLMFLSKSERDVVKTAIEEYSSVDEEELLDVLQAHDCKRVARESNITEIVAEIAHKELIQQPMFVIDCWRPELQSMAFIEHSQLTSIYSSMIPTNTLVLKSLCFPSNMSDSERGVAKFLKTYVKELDVKDLSKFLRFSTGSDLLNASGHTQISVEFQEMSDFERRPIGHTCGRVLELANGFDNYPQFRSEFNGVLQSDIWVMDIA